MQAPSQKQESQAQRDPLKAKKTVNSIKKEKKAST